MRKIGVEKALKAAGVQEGDSVILGSLELEWSEIPAAPYGYSCRRPETVALRKARGRPRAAERRRRPPAARGAPR